MPFILKNIWEHPTKNNIGIQLNTTYKNLHELQMNKNIQTKADSDKAERRCVTQFCMELSGLKYKQEIC